LESKLCIDDFVHFVQTRDIIGFVETWLHDDSKCAKTFPGFKIFSYFRPKTHKKGRPSGGVTVLIKNKLAKGIKHVYNDYDMIFTFT